MNWDAVKAGYKVVFLLLIPVFIIAVWALLNEKHEILIALMFAWLIGGNIAFFKAYNKKMTDK